MASTSFAPQLDDSSATPITSDTVDTAIKLSHSSSPRRLLKSTSAAVKIIGTAIGIPGVSEVGEKVGRLIQQTSNGHHAEIVDLGAHLQGMLHIADPNRSLLERQLAESSRYLESMRRQVDEMQRGNRPPSAVRARELTEEVERLSKQTDRLADRQILMHLRMQDLAAQARHLDMSSQIESIVETTSQTQKLLIPVMHAPAPEPDDFPEDKVLAIDLDSIECQEVELSYMATKKEFDFICSCPTCAPTHSDNIAFRVTCTTGLLNGVRVMRKSYNSPDRAIATQLAKRDLVSLSKYTHPNCASLKGVARDMHGQIREIIVTTEPMAQKEFLESVKNPAAVARYMKGMRELHELEKMSNWSIWWMGGGVQIRVNYNGQVTAIPAADGLKSVWDWFNPQNTKRSPAAEDILKIFYNQFGRCQYRQNPSGLGRFIDGVSQLWPRFTPLDVLKVAVGATITPPLSLRGFATFGRPSTTFSAGGIVIKESKRCVRVLEKRSRQAIPTYFREPSILIDTHSHIDGWHTFTVPRSGGFVTWREHLKPEPWEVFRTKAKRISQSHSIDLHRIC